MQSISSRERQASILRSSSSRSDSRRQTDDTGWLADPCPRPTKQGVEWVGKVRPPPTGNGGQLERSPLAVRQISARL
ncbi:hypothetical protein JJD41_18100 [Oxynema sp. CENA135]|nr:hypothetical protein [Oxynema sp. CENA135]